MNCFERASLPNLSEEDRKKSLHFVVISGGPTGVEFFAKLHDFVQEDLSKLYHNALELVKISWIEAGEHILTMFVKKITQFTEEKFQWEGIDVKTNIIVVKVHGDSLTMTNTSTGEVNIPYGMAIWCTDFGTCLIILGFMKQIDQGNMHVLETVEWLRVLGCENIYALGDFSIISQQKVMVALYLKTKKMQYFLDLLKESEGEVVKESVELDIERFMKGLSQVDSQVKMLPALAQVAAQEGENLAKCFNKMKFYEENPEGPLCIRGDGRHHFKPIRYRHLGQFPHYVESKQLHNFLVIGYP
ncbi:NAD(P)H dehydrogenase B3, mitochondrial [Dendrobium catenatum]|uniref:NAD(P)H dehydrogenase B3, mitochondrial n=1 Tax=Dendrobium catenatum TaxID=906689 RepID=A0A2I0VK00_9ASPA|nr:NAD(P)H dehydrogenase B3, mitochondrial [Dendrobium catenatum]